jgi:hypothetical protein
MSETPRFVGEPLVPGTTFVNSSALSQGEPPLPTAFRWGTLELSVLEVLSTWRSTKTDRGDDYLAKHWYEIRTTGERRAVLYFDRKARAGRPRWWLYTITGSDR